jgi:hypothetical protein
MSTKANIVKLKDAWVKRQKKAKPVRLATFGGAYFVPNAALEIVDPAKRAKKTRDFGYIIVHLLDGEWMCSCEGDWFTSNCRHIKRAKEEGWT